MSTLVIGGTGTVGSEVVRGLLAGGEDVRVLTRSADGAQELPDGVRGAIGDLAQPGTLPAAFKGVDRVFMITPLSEDETELGLNGVRAATDAGVDRIVYMTVHRLQEGAHIPHFASKIPVAEEIEDSGLSYTFLEPNNFFQNDVWFREPITRMGVYPQPIGNVGISRVDLRDIADAAVNVLTGSGHDGKSYPVVGPDLLTGQQVAEIWSRALGREVEYAGDDLEAWAENARQTMPDWLVHDFRIMYEHFQDEGLVATDEDLEACRAVIGHEPRSFRDFTAELAQDWAG